MADNLAVPADVRGRSNGRSGRQLSWSSRARVFRRNDASQPATTSRDGQTYANPHDQEKANEPEDTVRPNKLPSYNAHGHRVNHQGHRVTRGIEPDGESGRSWINPMHMAKICWRSASVYSKWVNILWPFTIAALVLYFNYRYTQELWIFITAYIGMVPAANLVGFAGQELARKLPKVWGVILETTFGSIVEIILFMVLIRSADTEPNNISVIRAAILGSILANLLFCLGMIASLFVTSEPWLTSIFRSMLLCGGDFPSAADFPRGDL
jgi:Ca2+:H+ antiporter